MSTQQHENAAGDKAEWLGCFGDRVPIIFCTAHTFCMQGKHEKASPWKRGVKIFPDRTDLPIKGNFALNRRRPLVISSRDGILGHKLLCRCISDRGLTSRADPVNPLNPLNLLEMRSADLFFVAQNSESSLIHIDLHSETRQSNCQNFHLTKPYLSLALHGDPYLSNSKSGCSIILALSNLRPGSHPYFLLTSKLKWSRVRFAVLDSCNLIISL